MIVIGAVAVSKTRDLAIGGDAVEEPSRRRAPDDDTSAAQHEVDLHRGDATRGSELEEEHVKR